MELFVALAGLKKAYDIYKEISSLFIDETVNILQLIAEKECESAIKTLQDSKYSNDKIREVESAITQLRLAIEKTESLELKCKISAIIAMCYKVLNEATLMDVFKQRSIEYFAKYTNWRLACIEALTSPRQLFFVNPYRIYDKIMVASISTKYQYESLVLGIKRIGINVDNTETLGAFLKDLFMPDRFSTRAKTLVIQSQKQFIISINNILNV